MVVHKYRVGLSDLFAVEMPRGAQILDVQVQRGTPQMWALVDPAAPIERRQFRLVGTGHHFKLFEDQQPKHVGTFQLDSGALVFHLFEIVDA